MIKTLALSAAGLGLASAFTKYDQSLAHCQEFSLHFHNTCDTDGDGNTVAASSVEEMAGESYAFSDVKNCWDGQTDDNGQCTWTRKLCVSCFMDGDQVRTGKAFDEQNVDWSVDWNPLVSDWGVVSFETQDDWDYHICGWEKEREYVNRVKSTAGYIDNTDGAGASDNHNAVNLYGTALDHHSANYDDPAATSRGAVFGLDACNGHGQGTGKYHYHTLTPCIVDADIGATSLGCQSIDGCMLNNEMNAHDWYLNGWTSSDEVIEHYSGEVIGLARDGHPIYSPIKSGSTKDDYELWGVSEVDGCNGVQDTDGTYYYVGTQFYPYAWGCFGPAQGFDSANPLYTACSQNNRCRFVDGNDFESCRDTWGTATADDFADRLDLGNSISA